MLVLTRRPMEQVTLIVNDANGAEIERILVGCVEIREGCKVRLGFRASDRVRIIRNELLPAENAKEMVAG